METVTLCGGGCWVLVLWYFGLLGVVGQYRLGVGVVLRWCSLGLLNWCLPLCWGTRLGGYWGRGCCSLLLLLLLVEEGNSREREEGVCLCFSWVLNEIKREVGGFFLDVGFLSFIIVLVLGL